MEGWDKEEQQFQMVRKHIAGKATLPSSQVESLILGWVVNVFQEFSHVSCKKRRYYLHLYSQENWDLEDLSKIFLDGV